MSIEQSVWVVISGDDLIPHVVGVYTDLSVAEDVAATRESFTLVQRVALHRVPEQTHSGSAPGLQTS